MAERLEGFKKYVNYLGKVLNPLTKPEVRASVWNTPDDSAHFNAERRENAAQEYQDPEIQLVRRMRQNFRDVALFLPNTGLRVTEELLSLPIDVGAAIINKMRWGLEWVLKAPPRAQLIPADITVDTFGKTSKALGWTQNKNHAIHEGIRTKMANALDTVLDKVPFLGPMKQTA